MKNVPLLIATIFGTLALIVGVAVAFSRSSTDQQVADRSVLESEARLAKGPSQAQVVIVEFSDLQCPACRAIQPLMNEVVQKYPDRVQLIYRHYPLLEIHPYAGLAAQASEVAAQEGKFWEMHDLLFAKQDEWSSLGNQDEVIAKFGEYGSQLGIDKAKLSETIQSEEIKTKVAQDMALGAQLKVNATPTIYVNGQVTAPQRLLTTVGELLETAQ